MSKRKRTIATIIVILFVVILCFGSFVFFNHKGDEAEAALEKADVLHLNSVVSLSMDIFHMSARNETNSDEYRAALDLRNRLDELNDERKIVLSTRGAYLLPWRYADAVNSLLDRYEDIWKEIEASEE